MANSTEPVSHHEEESPPADVAVLFVAFALFLGSATRFIFRNTRVPYTVSLLVLGVLLGVWTKSGLGVLGESVELASEIDPALFLNIFLPLLIFESASSVNWHTFIRSLPQVLMLAGPGLLIATFLGAVVIKFVLLDSFNWAEALMLGSLLSATDPVAVVALLKELGAPATLGTLIEGESLLNDGTAIVLFTVTVEIARGSTADAGHITETFFQLSLGGVALGLAWAFVTIFWIGRIFGDELLEITITLMSAYLLFFVADVICKVSGVLAVVTLGVCFAGYGKTRISPEVENSLHHFWSTLSYHGNTLVFVLAGVIMVMRANFEAFSADDYGRLLALYAFLTIIRAFMVFALAPALRRFGYGLSWKQASVLVYGGLRGAVSLALALNVALDEEIEEDVRDYTLFFASGIAFLTLLVNATTTAPLLSYLGLTRPTKAQLELFKSTTERLDEYTEFKISALAKDKLFSGCNWDQVEELAISKRYKDMVQEHLDAEVAKPKTVKMKKMPHASDGHHHGHGGSHRHRFSGLFTSSSSNSLATMANAIGAEHNGDSVSRTSSYSERPSSTAPDDDHQHHPSVSPEDSGSATPSLHNEAVAEDGTLVARDEAVLDDPLKAQHVMHARLRFLNGTKAVYWEQFESGFLERDGVMILMNAADEAEDFLEHPLAEWDQTLDRYCTHPTTLEYLQECNVMVMHKLVEHLITKHIALSLNVASAFVAARKRVLADLSDLVDDPEIWKILSHECGIQLNKARDYLKSTQVKYPKIINSIHTKQATRLVLTWRRQFVDVLSQHGLLMESEVEHLQRTIKDSLSQLALHPPKITFPKYTTTLRHSRVFSGVEDDIFERALDIMSAHLYLPNAPIVRKGEPVDGLFVVLEGFASFQTRNRKSPDYLGPGLIFGAIETLSQQPALLDIAADSDVKAAFFPRDQFLMLAADSPTLKRNFHEIAIFHLSYLVRSKLFKAATSDGMRSIGTSPIAMQEHIRPIIEAGHMKDCHRGESLYIDNLGILIRGELMHQSVKGGPAFDNPFDILTAAQSPYQAIHASTVYIIPTVNAMPIKDQQPMQWLHHMSSMKSSASVSSSLNDLRNVDSNERSSSASGHYANGHGNLRGSNTHHALSTLSEESEGHEPNRRGAKSATGGTTDGDDASHNFLSVLPQNQHAQISRRSNSHDGHLSSYGQQKPHHHHHHHHQQQQQQEQPAVRCRKHGRDNCTVCHPSTAMPLFSRTNTSGIPGPKPDAAMGMVTRGDRKLPGRSGGRSIRVPGALEMLHTSTSPPTSPEKAAGPAPAPRMASTHSEPPGLAGPHRTSLGSASETRAPSRPNHQSAAPQHASSLDKPTRVLEHPQSAPPTQTSFPSSDHNSPRKLAAAAAVAGGNKRPASVERPSSKHSSTSSRGSRDSAQPLLEHQQHQSQYPPWQMPPPGFYPGFGPTPPWGYPGFGYPMPPPPFVPGSGMMSPSSNQGPPNSYLPPYASMLGGFYGGGLDMNGSFRNGADTSEASGSAASTPRSRHPPQPQPPRQQSYETAVQRNSVGSDVASPAWPYGGWPYAPGMMGGFGGFGGGYGGAPPFFGQGGPGGSAGQEDDGEEQNMGPLAEDEEQDAMTNEGEDDSDDGGLEMGGSVKSQGEAPAYDTLASEMQELPTDFQRLPTSDLVDMHVPPLDELPPDEMPPHDRERRESEDAGAMWSDGSIKSLPRFRRRSTPLISVSSVDAGMQGVEDALARTVGASPAAGDDLDTKQPRASIVAGLKEIAQAMAGDSGDELPDGAPRGRSGHFGGRSGSFGRHLNRNAGDTAAPSTAAANTPLAGAEADDTAGVQLRRKSPVGPDLPRGDKGSVSLPARPRPTSFSPEFIVADENSKAALAELQRSRGFKMSLGNFEEDDSAGDDEDEEEAGANGAGERGLARHRAGASLLANGGNETDGSDDHHGSRSSLADIGHQVAMDTMDEDGVLTMDDEGTAIGAGALADLNTFESDV